MKNAIVLFLILTACSAYAQNNANPPKDTCSFAIPSVFTAGSYERIHFSANCTCIEFKMEIYNRWGEKMYVQEELNNFVIDWNTDVVEKGTYVWIINAKVAVNSEVFEVSRMGNISVMK